MSNRSVWANFNKGLLITMAGIGLVTFLSLLWDGEALTWNLFKVTMSVGGFTLVSSIIYAAKYDP